MARSWELAGTVMFIFFSEVWLRICLLKASKKSMLDNSILFLEYSIWIVIYHMGCFNILISINLLLRFVGFDLRWLLRRLFQLFCSFLFVVQWHLWLLNGELWLWIWIDALALALRLALDLQIQPSILFVRKLNWALVSVKLKHLFTALLLTVALRQDLSSRH